MDSKHYAEDRQKREEIIATIGYGKIIKTVRVDRGHWNGAEIHKISDTGIVTIFNERTRKMITKLIARPGQLKRYFQGEKIPTSVLEKAITHQRLGLNNL